MVFVHRVDDHSIIHKIDPRLRIITALTFSFIVVGSKNLITLIMALSCALISVLVAGLPKEMLFKRIVKLNVFVLLLFLLTGEESRMGVGVIALKSNTLLLWLSAFLSTIDSTSLGHALNHLKVPDKLTHLFLTTVRYIDVLFMEYQRLVQAMKIRGFQPQMNVHTYRTYSYLVGMLLVKSFDRSERIFDAMKCRGFNGHFYMFDHFHWHRTDTAASVLLGMLCSILIGAECLLI